MGDAQLEIGQPWVGGNRQSWIIDAVPLLVPAKCASGRIRTVEFRLDRRALTVTTFAEEARANRALTYWRSRPAAERLAAVEFLRRQFIGPGARLRRVLRVIERT